MPMHSQEAYFKESYRRTLEREGKLLQQLDLMAQRDREIWEMIEKTQSCTSGISNADCLEWVKKKIGEVGSVSKSVTPLEEE